MNQKHVTHRESPGVNMESGPRKRTLIKSQAKKLRGKIHLAGET